MLYTPNGNYIEVESIGEYWINAAGGNEGDAYDKLSGVPLTEEILLKCGFGKHVVKMQLLDYEDYRKGNMVINITDGGFEIEFGSELFSIEERTHITTCHYLHELQNIYYWLSGKKELEVKL